MALIPPPTRPGTRRVLLALGIFGLFNAVQTQAQCVASTAAWQRMESAILELSDGRNPPLTLHAMVADDGGERAAGYQHICAASMPGTAILFVFPHITKGLFHMQNVYGPLDIVFFDPRGAAVDHQRMGAEPPGRPVRQRLYGSTRPYLLALEIPAGLLEDSNLDIDRLKIRIQVEPESDIE